MAIKDNLQPFWGFNVGGITKDDGSANDAFISGLQSELDKTELELYQAKLESYLNTATGRWLDYWGSWLGLHRDERDDESYRLALIHHVLHERNTIPSLKKALIDFLGLNKDNIYIYEPWRDMFIWNASHYNTYKFFTSPYYRYAVIDIMIEGPYQSILNEVVNLFRPAGVYWVVTNLVNVVNNTAPILDFSLPTTQIMESADTDYANFTQTNSAYLTSKLDLATYVDDPYHYNKDKLNDGKQYMTSNSSYNPVVYIGSNKEEYNTTIKTTGGGVNLVKKTDKFLETTTSAGDAYIGGLTPEEWKQYEGKTLTFSVTIEWKNWQTYGPNRVGWELAFHVDGKTIWDVDKSPHLWVSGQTNGSSGKKRLSATITVPENIDDTIAGQTAYIQSHADYFKISDLMVEEGTVAHPWSPSPYDSDYASWLQNKYQEELSITSQQLKQQLGNQITSQPALINSIDSQAKAFKVDQKQTSLLGGVDLLDYLTVYKQAVKPNNQTAKQFILTNLASSNTQRLELVLQNQANTDLTQDVRLGLYDYNLHLWIKPLIEYEVHSDYTIFKISLPSLAPYLSDGGNFMFQVWPTTSTLTTLSVNYLGYLFNAPSDIITLANSDETFTMETK